MSTKIITDFDNHKLSYHPSRVNSWLNKQKTYPIFVEIAPTAACNYKCSFCAFDYVIRKNKTFSKDKFYSLMDEFAELGVKSIMLAGEGEPLLHENIDEFSSYAKNKGIDVSITTNGSLLHRINFENLLPYLSWIRISLNASSEKNFEKIHSIQGKVFQQVLKNLKEAAAYKKRHNLKVTIGVQFLLIDDNYHEAEEMAKICSGLGVDYLSIKPYSHHPKSINNHKTDYNKFSDLKEKIMQYATDDYKILYRSNAMNCLEKKKSYNSCHGLDFFSLIDAEGNVIPCNVFFDGDDKYVFGNINDQSFKEIWNGEKRKQSIEIINKNIHEDCRLGCRLETMNHYLERLINPFEHDNFI